MTPRDPYADVPIGSRFYVWRFHWTVKEHTVGRDVIVGETAPRPAVRLVKDGDRKGVLVEVERLLKYALPSGGGNDDVRASTRPSGGLAGALPGGAPGGATDRPQRATDTTKKEEEMSAKSPKEGKTKVSAREVAYEILTAAGRVMTASELAEATLADPRVTLGGKTPKATVGAIVYTEAKKGRRFRKVEGGFEAIPLDEMTDQLTAAAHDTDADAQGESADGAEAEPASDVQGDGAQQVEPDPKPQPKRRSRQKAKV